MGPPPQHGTHRSRARDPRSNPTSPGPQYEADSAPAVALQATIDKTNARFDKYAKQGLLCGTDGLPHLIADPGLAFRYGHTGDVFLPTLGFVYVAGFIGHAGREYLKYAKSTAKPENAEIIIDVPKAIGRDILGKAAVWPSETVKEWRNGTLLEKEENITVSPR